MKTKKIFFLFIFLSLSSFTFSQSISIQDLKVFLKVPKDQIESYLLDKAFVLTNKERWGDTVVRTYNKGLETLFIGGGFVRKDGSWMPDVIYTSGNGIFVTNLLDDLTDFSLISKTEVPHKISSQLENDKYYLQLVISLNNSESSSILLALK